jgi:EmrB/QacA subfamily drug resistance transporter
MSTKSVNSMGSQNSMSLKAIAAPLAALIIGMFMVVLDNTAMNVMIPRLIKDFGSSYNEVQWAVTGYVLAQAAVIPLAGWLSDRFGAKRVFLISIGLFAMGSLLCAFAQGIDQLVFFRILQGLGGGMVVPIGFAYTFRLSPPSQVGRVMGLISIPILLAPALGPVLAGWMVDYLSWHWIFLINIPIGIFGVLFGIRNLPKIEKQAVAGLDSIGMVLAPIAFASLSYGISESGMGWNSEKTLWGLIVGGIALALFVITQLRRTNPLLELRVFGSGSFTRTIFVLWTAQFALFGTQFLLPQLLQNLRGYSAFDAGLIMLPYAVATGLVMQLSGRLFDKFGVRWLAISGLGIVAFALFLLSRVSTDTNVGMILLPIVLQGVGTGLCMMPLNTSLLKSAPQHLVSRVTSLTSALQQVVVSFAVAGLATVLTSKAKVYTESGSQMDAWPHAFHDTFLVVMSIAIAGAILGFIIRKPKADSTKAAAEVNVIVES